MSSPMLNLREPWATSCTLPMARSTCDGSSDPDVQAEPDDAWIPLSSRRSKSDSPSIPSKQKLTLPGSLFRASPLRAECSIEPSPLMSLSLSLIRRAEVSSMPATASLRALAMAAIPGTFSVPALRPFSWAPPSIRFTGFIPFFT